MPESIFQIRSDDPLGAFVPGETFVRDGAAGGPLSGLHFAAKDLFDVKGHVTGCGNPDWAATQAPSQDDAPAVQAWLDAGATLVGKTITDELAFSLAGRNAHYGTPTNSNAPGRIPGGSSSGSASAVAGGAADLALGSDTGGSVRIPGSYCGLYGLRPTHGRISLQGVNPLAPSLDTVGWFARDAQTLRLGGEALLGEAVASARQPGGLILAEDIFGAADAGTRSAMTDPVRMLEFRLGRAERMVVGEPGGGLDAWMLCLRRLLGREAWLQHGDWVEKRRPRLGPDIAERFVWAKSISVAQAGEATAAREDFTARIRDRLGEDLILCFPTAPGIAPSIDAPPEAIWAERDRVSRHTFVAGLAGLPQITLPLATVEGCPVGLSLVGPPGSDMMLLAFAEALSRAPADGFSPPAR